MHAQPSVGNEEVGVFELLLFQRDKFHASIYVGGGHALCCVGAGPNEPFACEVKIALVFRLFAFHLLSLVRHFLSFFFGESEIDHLLREK